MKRLLPSSLLGQVMTSVALALLVAQILSVVLLARAAEDRRETTILTAAAFQLVNGADRTERRERGAELRREARRSRAAEAPQRRILRGNRTAARGGRLPFQLRYIVSANAPLAGVQVTAEGAREERLRAALALEGIEPHRVAVAVRRAGEDPALLEFAGSHPRYADRSDWRERRLFIAAIQRTPSGPWEAARILEPESPKAALGVLVFQTLLTFAFLIVILFFVLRRITRPLAQLTERVSDFSRQPDRAVMLAEAGPSDTRRLIAAHNMMEARIAALLDEKNVMLGAIGHDLKTPLAALRVRIESVPDDAQRRKMAASIEDITATLDDILALARVGHVGRQEFEPVAIIALAQGVVEEFEDMGEPVTMIEPPENRQRLVARVQVTWLKRALRNLVSNAVRYGECAEISVREETGLAVLRVEDRGPGIAPDQIAAMMEPFTRGEASRNRATGGAGLGLTLASAIAQQHGGELLLTNRAEGGLRAELRLPL